MVNNPMPHVRAAVAYLNTVGSPERRKQMELFAFLAIFHPKMPIAKRRQLVFSK
jgi:hypothetical protein